jgi:predicted GNAT family acetyltransferase
MNVDIIDNPQAHRFEARTEDGTVAGKAHYRTEDRPEGEVVVFTHTVVDDEFEGEGVGSSLARGALDQVRQRGQKIKAECSFIHSFVDEHPEYADLVA